MFCRNCGENIDQDAYCRYCGTKTIYVTNGFGTFQHIEDIGEYSKTKPNAYNHKVDDAYSANQTNHVKNVFSFIALLMIGSSYISGLILYIASFVLWYDYLGGLGLLLALFFAPDIILIILRIARNGITDWYVLCFVATIIVYVLGVIIKSISDD